MAFLSLFSGNASPPRGKQQKAITLMEYTNTKHIPKPCSARKYCYIIKCGDLQKIFANAGVAFTGERRIKCSFWNRRHPVPGKEYGVEICEDDNCDPFYIVYRKHWKNRKVETQVTIYADAIKPNQAVSLDKQLRTHNIP